VAVYIVREKSPHVVYHVKIYFVSSGGFCYMKMLMRKSRYESGTSAIQNNKA